MLLSMVLLTSTALILIDQLLKAWVLRSMVGMPSFLLIPGLLQLTYVENRGAAFGILQGRVPILSIVTGLVVLALLVVMVRGMVKSRFALWSFGLILAGGIGNLIDRIFRGYVIDYLDISPLFSFPVFNFADCCVVIGTCMVLIYVFFLEGKEKRMPPAPSQGEQTIE